MTFDVIVVGGGSAGCVLAARLSEDPARQVLLIEAGPDFADPAHLPEDLRDGALATYSHDWGFRSEPGALGRSLRQPRGRVMGGCSATNAAIALRGQAEDYDAWTAAGNAGCSARFLLCWLGGGVAAQPSRHRVVATAHPLTHVAHGRRRQPGALGDVAQRRGRVVPDQLARRPGGPRPWRTGTRRQ